MLKDLKVDEKGDFVLNKRDIGVVDNDELRYQKAFTKLLSVKIDWFLDEYGCDLEDFLGLPLKDTMFKGYKAKIRDALISGGLFKADDVYIELTSHNNILGISVYIRGLDEISSKRIDVDLDIVKGVNVRLGVD